MITEPYLMDDYNSMLKIIHEMSTPYNGLKITGFTLELLIGKGKMLLSRYKAALEATRITKLYKDTLTFEFITNDTCIFYVKGSDGQFHYLGHVCGDFVRYNDFGNDIFTEIIGYNLSIKRGKK